MSNSDVLLSEIGAYVPVPTLFIDTLMPTLKDTEWRLLCVVVRQTLGWQSGSGRKRRDWMSQTQLMARTGRNSAALSAALDSLVRKNLIQCSTNQGDLLLTSKERRNFRGRVYFALAPRFFTTTPIEPHTAYEPSRIQGWTSAGDIAQKQRHTKGELRKTKRTKETQETVETLT